MYRLGGYLMLLMTSSSGFQRKSGIKNLWFLGFGSLKRKRTSGPDNLKIQRTNVFGRSLVF